MKCKSIIAALALAGCASGSGSPIEAVGLGDTTALPARSGTVIVDGCVLDTWQSATLATTATRKVLREVVLLCLVPRLDGTVGPRDPSALAALDQLVGVLHGEGYRVKLGVSFTDETGQRYDGAQTASWLANATWRTTLVTSLPGALGHADGIELDLQQLPASAVNDVTALVHSLSDALRPARAIGIFVPPTTDGSTDDDGPAFARRQLAPYVDRMRVMTLDYSLDSPGPTIDPGWAVDAVRNAANDFPNVDIAYPLYGTDFGPAGRRSVTYNDGVATARTFDVPILRGATDAPYVKYSGYPDQAHQLWFDDAESTGRALAAWSADVLPLGVGVVFYGLGAEDPLLFEKLAGRMP